MDPRNIFFMLVFGGLGLIVLLSLYMMVFVVWVEKIKVENGTENQGFPRICTEKDGTKFLKKILRKKS